MTKANQPKEKPRTRFCWHCGRQLRGNHYREHETPNGSVVVHRQCKEILDGGFDFVRAVDDED